MMPLVNHAVGAITGVARVTLKHASNAFSGPAAAARRDLR
jgi:hypothetical protein